MLRITVEIIGFGDETRPPIRVGECTITNDNDHPDHPRLGNYTATVVHRSEVTEVKVRDFPRLEFNAWFLLSHVLEQYALRGGGKL